MTVAPSARAGWNRFWFAPRSTAPVEVFRIALGLLVLVWLLSMTPVIEPFYGSDRAVPGSPPLPTGAWTLFSLAPTGTTAWPVWLVGVLAALALAVGCGTRLAAVLVFVIVMSLIRQSPWVFNYGDGLIRILAFYMMFMPAGSALSVDRWRSDPTGLWTFPRRAPWALRLAQIQLSVIYLSAVWEKSGGSLWRDGSAISIALRVVDVNRVPAPVFVTDSVALVQLLTFGALAVEAAAGVLVWNRVARPWVLSLAALLHISIDVSLMTGFFSFAMLTLYSAFLGPQAAERLMDAIRSRAGTRRARGRPARGALAEESAVPTAEAIAGGRNPSPEPPPAVGEDTAGRGAARSTAPVR